MGLFVLTYLLLLPEDIVEDPLQVTMEDGSRVAIVGTLDVTLDRITAVLSKSVTEASPSFLSNVCVAPFGYETLYECHSDRV